MYGYLQYKSMGVQIGQDAGRRILKEGTGYVTVRTVNLLSCNFRHRVRLVKKKNYRSENFSTTRTLSPRTVIGMGTTLS
jgi:hypothetical protein